MNKKIWLSLLVLGLCACDGTLSTSGSNVSLSVPPVSFEESITSTSIESSMPSMQDLSLNFPSRGGSENLPSTNSTTSNFTSNSTLSSKTSNSTSTIKALSETDFMNYLTVAITNDRAVNSVDITSYYVNGQQYQVQTYTMTEYSNDITYINGTSTTRKFVNTGSEIIANSSFIEQRLYQDGYYTRIRKFDSDYSNTSERFALDSSEDADYYLNVGQAYNLYSVITSFKTVYDLTYSGTIENGIKEVNYTYLDFSDDYLNSYNICLGVVIMGKLDENNNLIDFYYAEGYFDAYYAMDGVEAMRRHGLYPIGNSSGRTYEMKSFKKNEKTSYDEELVYKLEDNFITEMSFTQDEINVTLQGDISKDYIVVLDYLIFTPDASFTSGCPINNLQITSSDDSIVQVYSEYVVTFTAVGEATITVCDLATNVKTSNSLKIIVQK